MREVLGVALFLLAIGLSGAAVLHLVGSGATRRSVSILWAVALTIAWAAWYVVQGRTL